MSSGWKCPGCGRCYAPWVAECRPCSPPTTTSQPYPAPYPHGRPPNIYKPANTCEARDDS